MPFTHTCEICSKDFSAKDRNRRFCGSACYGLYKRTIRGSAHPNFGKKRPEWVMARARAAREPKRGCDNPAWKGGRSKDRRGYMIVNLPSLSPEDQLLFPNHKTNYVFEHRLIVARRLKRPLRSGEHVHHVNGIKDDNRDENLELVDASKHTHEHAMIWKRISALEAENARLRETVADLQRRLPQISVEKWITPFDNRRQYGDN